MTNSTNTNDLLTKDDETDRIAALERRVAALEASRFWPQAYPPYYQPWYPATPVWCGPGNQA